MATESTQESAMHKKRRATHAQVIEVADLLRLHCITSGPGFALYEDGWDDRKIVAALDFDCAESTVASIRRDILGDLTKKNHDATDMIRAIARLNVLEEQHNELTKHIGLLLLELKINHGISVNSALLPDDAS